MQLETAMRNALADEFDNYINTTGSGTATLQLRDSSDTEIVQFDLQNPAFGAASSGAITLQGTTITSNTASSAATIDDAAITDRGSTVVATLGVATSGSPDLTLSSTSIASGEAFDLTSFSVTVSAGSQTT